MRLLRCSFATGCQAACEVVSRMPAHTYSSCLWCSTHHAHINPTPKPQTLLIALCRAPELIDDEIDSASAGTACDTWSLAATLLHSLTGTAPYNGMRSLEMRRALLLRHAPGPIPEDLPAGLQRMLRQSFHADPAQRPSLAEVKQVHSLCVLSNQNLMGWHVLR